MAHRLALKRQWEPRGWEPGWGRSQKTEGWALFFGIFDPSSAILELCDPGQMVQPELQGLLLEDGNDPSIYRPVFS